MKDKKVPLASRRSFLGRSALLGGALAAAGASRPSAQPAAARGPGAFYEKGDVRIHYRAEGSGPALFVIYGGSLNSRLDGGAPASLRRPSGPFDVFAEFSSRYRCIAMDLRNANGGQTVGPLAVDDPWNAYTDDHLALLDHLGVDRFMVIGFCIGNPLIWNLLQRAPGRVAAAVSAQPSAIMPGVDKQLIAMQLENWAPGLLASRPEITMDQVRAFVHSLYAGKEFIPTTTRDFVRRCPTPILALPDDNWAHPYAACMEMVNLAPQGQVSLYPWKDNAANLKLALRHIDTFLKANAPTA